METVAARVKEHAGALGFHIVGIARAKPFLEAEERYARWIADGNHGEMAWFNQERVRKSTHPDDLVPGARSIISLGVSYLSSADDVPIGDSPRGRVARYARGTDYHDVLKARVDELAAFIREIGPDDTRTRTFVDTAPLLDREAAVQSGLGFYGKNTNLLTAPLGSYLLIATVITTLELDPDETKQRDCGQCRLCLDACPTQAFTAPYVLDARRCIAYLTIELKEPIPADLRDLVTLDTDGFRQRYRGTAVVRTKRRGLLRNAAIALGNSGDVASVPALIQALSDDEPLVRGAAAWALGEIGNPEAMTALGARLEVEVETVVRDEIAQALASSTSRQASAQ
jgi:epoxyqueuosine reductase